MSNKQDSKPREIMLLVVRDGWLPDRYFDATTKGRMEADAYVERCNRCYVDHYEVRPVSLDYPKRFDKATNVQYRGGKLEG